MTSNNSLSFVRFRRFYTTPVGMVSVNALFALLWATFLMQHIYVEFLGLRFNAVSLLLAGFVALLSLFAAFIIRWSDKVTNENWRQVLK